MLLWLHWFSLCDLYSNTLKYILFRIYVFYNFGVLS